MTAELVLSVLQGLDDARGYVAGFAVTDQMIVAVGGTSSRSPMVIASSDGTHFAARGTPNNHGLRDVLAVGDALWTCGESGQLAVSRDHGGHWQLLATGTEACLLGLALGSDGALWVVGEGGYAARVLGERPRRVDLGSDARLVSVHAVRDEIVALGGDGLVRRWRDGKVTAVACGAPGALTSLAITSKGTWVVLGDGGFVARSPDGTWYSRVKLGREVALEALGALADGTLVAVGDRGVILRSTDDARSWQPIANELGLVHLWSIERRGGDLLIGGDAGLVLSLGTRDDQVPGERTEAATSAAEPAPGDEEPAAAPLLARQDDEPVAAPLLAQQDEEPAAAPLLARQDDEPVAAPPLAPWDGRLEPAVEPAAPGDELPTLDAVFAAGPEGFIATGLATYLEVLDSDRGLDDGEDDGADDPGDDTDDPAFALLAGAGNADAFRSIYGVAFPDEARRFFDLIAGRDRWSSFTELRLDSDLLPEVGEHNLFELLVRRNQHAYLGTDLVEAFCGVFGIGSQGNGDTYHLEVYEWDGRRQVLHFDHETAAFSGVFADSLDSLVYLAALVKLGDAQVLSQATYTAGLHQLRGKVAPTWHFSIDDKDDGFVALASERRDTEFFFFRARWICALLKNDGVTELAEVAQLFDPELNQVIAPDQLAARYEACEQYIPTALYAVWRAYLFDEPELAHYLELGRRHAARLVRDAARLIDELCGGRNELGTISDVRAWLAAFRALDLDPRRAEQRAAEAEQRRLAEAARRAEHDATLARTPAAGWHQLAWQWVEDGVGHRALLSRLDPTQVAQLVAIDALRDASDAERAIALPRIAVELTPAVEAVLVGSLVRDDKLEGVVTRPHDHAAACEADAGEDEPARSPGWQAIDRALAPLYGGIEPLHYGTVVPYGLGGNDPIHGISAYRRTDPAPHWHFVTYGFTDLFRKQTEDPDASGFGFELTLRLARAADEDQPPIWALNFLQNLGRYVFSTGNAFAAGHKMGLNGPIALDSPTAITAICFADDPELGAIDSEFGKARFVQIVGLTDDEYRLIQEWSTTGLVEILQRHLPALWTDVDRRSVLDDAAIAAEIRARVDREGSSEDLTFAGEIKLEVEADQIRIELGALYAATLPRAMRGRVRHGRPYQLRGREATLGLEPGDTPGYRLEDRDLVLELTPELAREIEVTLGDAMAGTYRFAAWPRLTIVITPSIIRAQDGSASEVRGVADPEEVARILAEDEARRAVASQDADEDDDADEDEVPDPARVAAALAMTQRGLRLAPEDDDLQFTHAMLLLDAERAGEPERADELLGALARYAPAVRVNIAVRMAKLGHPRFDQSVELALGEPLPEHVFGGGSTSAGGAVLASFGDVAHELFGELGEAILERAPRYLARLVPLLPGDATLFAELAQRALAAGEHSAAVALYDRLILLAIPDDGDARTSHLRTLNNACIQAHASKAFDAAVRIADHAQPVAPENPYIYHSAACAYAAVHDYVRAFEQVALAIEHDYEHVARIETDADLGPVLEWPEFHALFRDWHARREGN